MTNKDAIEHLKEIKHDVITRVYSKDIEALDEAIKTLKLRIPKLVDYISDGDADGLPVYDMAYCPNCEELFEYSIGNWGEPYCMKCGQALEWESEDSEEDG